MPKKEAGKVEDEAGDKEARFIWVFWQDKRQSVEAMRRGANIPETASAAARRVKWHSHDGMPGEPRRMAVYRRQCRRAPYLLASRPACKFSAAKPIAPAL